MNELLNGLDIIITFLPMAILNVLLINAIHKSYEGWISDKKKSTISIIENIILSLGIGSIYFFVKNPEYKKISIMLIILSIILNSAYIFSISVNFYELIFKGITNFVEKLLNNPTELLTNNKDKKDKDKK